MRYCFLILFLFTSTIATAQISLQTGFSGGSYQQYFSVDDENDILQPGEGTEMYYGVPLVLSKSKWSIQTGLYFHELIRSFYFSTPDGTRIGEKDHSIGGMRSLRIPLIFSRDFKLIERVSIAPHIGASWLLNRDRSPEGEPLDTGEGDFGNTASYTFTSSAVNKNKFLGELGMSLNINPFGYIILTGGVHYSFGFKTIEETRIDYNIQSGEGYTGQGLLETRGSGLSFQFGIKFPLYRLHGGHLRDF